MRNTIYSNNIQISNSNPNDDKYEEIYNIFIQIIQDILSHEVSEAHQEQAYQQGDDTNEET